MGAGRMVGDYECLHKIPYQTSMICYSPTAQVLVYHKDDLMKLKKSNEDAWQFIFECSQR